MGTIHDKLDQVREIFLAEVDEDERIDNLEMIKAWDKSIRENSAFATWQSFDISQSLIKQFRSLYLDASIQLAENRELTDAQRMSLWAKKDAALAVLDLISKDANKEIETISKEINRALNST